ncbi:hypothetical protein IU397_02935 [Actibacterium sp. 188UL27-1]|nr:hypothetical protein [Actibacterium sp. 188UL27-1]
MSNRSTVKGGGRARFGDMVKAVELRPNHMGFIVRHGTVIGACGAVSRGVGSATRDGKGAIRDRRSPVRLDVVEVARLVDQFQVVLEGPVSGKRFAIAAARDYFIAAVIDPCGVGRTSC